MSFGIKEFYNRVGKYFSKTRTYVWPELVPYLECVGAGDRVLDLGCGNGRICLKLASQVNYTGIDVSETLIKEARLLHPTRTFKVGDITKMKLTGKYDAIFCIAVLHHIPIEKHRGVLRKIKKHLKPGGFAVISVWNLGQKRYLKHHFRRDSLMLKKKNWRYFYMSFDRKYRRFMVYMGLPYLVRLVRLVGFEVKGKSVGRNILVEVG